MDAEKISFLKNEFLTMSIFAALGRSYTYKKNISDKERGNFHNALREQLTEISKSYASQVTEDEHVANIQSLSDKLSENFSGLLIDGRLRIGIAQKALNLYLKYLWCVDLIPSPPHCPFDAVILRHLPACSDLNWTSLDSIDDYLRLVRAARKASKDKPLANWELDLWTNSIQAKQKNKAVGQTEQAAVVVEHNTERKKINTKIKGDTTMTRERTMNRSAKVSENREIIFRPYSAWQPVMPPHDSIITLKFGAYWGKCKIGHVIFQVN